jgi:hypothetical protein
MKHLVKVMLVVAVSVLVCGCDMFSSDEPPPMPKLQGYPKDFVEGKKAYERGMAFYNQAKTAEGHQAKWDLCVKAKWEFRDAVTLIGPYRIHAPSGADIAGIDKYYNMADAKLLNLKDRLTPTGRMPKPGDP